MTYVTLADAKDHLSIDAGLTVHDVQLTKIIGAAEDWAENFTQRSLGELMDLDSPRDSDAVPLPNPVDSPALPTWPPSVPQPDWLSFPQSIWTTQQWQTYWAVNPIHQDHSKPLRRDVYNGILLKIQALFDRNSDDMKLLEDAAENMLWPYRIGLGV